MQYTNDKERILKNCAVDPVTACWGWTLSKDKCGYGTIKFRGQRCLAHRVSFMLLHDPIREVEIPKDMCVCHSCDNRNCVNPKHLFLGSHRANMEDMARKGRSNPGVLAKLKRADVIEIRVLLAAGVPQSVISVQFGVDKSTISRINTRDAWGLI